MNLKKKLNTTRGLGTLLCLFILSACAGSQSGKMAAQSENKNFALAGLWLEILAYADSRDENQARELFPELVSKDPNIRSEAQAEETMRQALQELMQIRSEYGLPKVCS